METVTIIVGILKILAVSYFTAVIGQKYISYLFSNKRERCYIAGKITGLPKEDWQYNFNVAAKHVETHLYYEAVNPIEKVPYKEGKGWWYYMVRDVYYILGCNAIYMQSNWRESKGARIEFIIAKTLLLKIIYQK
jgi:hypothetical protein